MRGKMNYHQVTENMNWEQVLVSFKEAGWYSRDYHNLANNYTSTKDKIFLKIKKKKKRGRQKQKQRRIKLIYFLRSFQIWAHGWNDHVKRCFIKNWQSKIWPLKVGLRFTACGKNTLHFEEVPIQRRKFSWYGNTTWDENTNKQLIHHILVKIAQSW